MNQPSKVGATWSLQYQLVRLLLVMVVLVWSLAAAVTWLDAKHELDELLDGHLVQSAALLAMNAMDDDDDHAHDVPMLHKYVPRVAFQVYVQGKLTAHTNNTGDAPMSATRDGFSTVSNVHGTWRVFASHDALRNVTVYVGEDTGSRQSILWAVMRSMLWPLLVALPVLALAGWWSVRRGLTPLRDLSQSLSRRRSEAVDALSLEGLPLELRPLVQSLNDLLARIGGLLESERRFTADAAHELRTPIAAIRTQAQVALGATESDERRRALMATLAGCDRATRLVEQLLTLARLEATSASKSAQVDLRQVAQRVLGDLAHKALGRSQQLELQAEHAMGVAADESLLAVLVRNLTDNALRYSPDGAQVEVALQTDAGATVLVVEDSGPGMTPEQMQHLGERFFRVLGNDQPGSGLGWSIVRRIAVVMGANISVNRSERLGGLRVRVQWPPLPPVSQVPPA